MQYRVITKEEHDALLIERALERNQERQKKLAEEREWLFNPRRKAERDYAVGEDVPCYGS